MGRTDVYGLPADIDLSFLVGTTLTQVCMGQNEFILNFDTGTSIMVASTVRLHGSTTDATEIDSAVEAGKILTAELGASVESASGTEDGTTTIVWSTGTVLSVLDTWPDFESYTITHGSTILVV